MEIKKRISFQQRFQYGVFQFMDHFLGRERAYALTKKRRQKFYRKLEKTLKEKGKGKVIPLERRTNLSLKEFQKEYVDKMKPVILEGAAKDWNCTKQWSLEYFKKLHGDDEIVFLDQNNITEPYNTMTLRELINGINDGTAQYYRFYPLLNRHPEHILDFDYNWLREKKNPLTILEAFQVFIGADKSITPIHNANQCNLFTQIEGEKEWRLYHYHDTAVIDPNPAGNVYRAAPFKVENGPFNPFEPDYAKPYNLYEYIDSYSVLLKPGDVLWNPPYYWHAVKNHGKSIGVGYRWLPPLYCFKALSSLCFLRLFCNQPSDLESL